MTTALDLITDTLERIGVYAPGEVISAADSSRCLKILNDMLDSWSNENLACFEETEQSGTLVPGKASYTVGSGGDFNVTRPLRINDDPGRAYTLDANGNMFGLRVLPRAQWNLFGNRTQVNSSIPTDLFYDPQFPLGVLNLYPVPNQSLTIFWDSTLQLTEFAGLTSVANLPLGYNLAIKSNLAIECWPYFKPDNSTPGAALIASARSSKAAVKRTNRRGMVAQFDPVLTRHVRRTYNPYRDE